jgi:hypothetical protein
MRPALAAVVCLLVMHAKPALGQSGCLPTDSTALYFRTFAREFVSRTDPNAVLIRSGSIFRVTDSTKVVLVTNATTCARVVTGFNTNRRTPGATRRLHVVDMNKQGYLIFEPLPRPMVLPRACPSR